MGRIFRPKLNKRAILSENIRSSLLNLWKCSIVNENEAEEVGTKEKWESRKLLCKSMVTLNDLKLMTVAKQWY